MNIILKLGIGALCVLGLLVVVTALFAPNDNVSTAVTTEKTNLPSEDVATEQTTQANTTETAAETQPESSNTATPTTYKVGDVVTDGKTNFVVNGMKTASKIDEKNNEFSVAEAQPGYEYMILDVTIENIGSETVSYSPTINFKVLDSSGYSYTEDFTAETALAKPLDGNNVVPGGKCRGEVPYLVPGDAQGLQLQFSFEAFGNNVATINLE
ncbi:MAG: DUF4352 domain-containing protein [Methanomethylovorans sp.]|uniref:DUF4352 domain-containing protein n=1 Tax=Methanomethylovorans sp. TaxID=2758717 RepID=UPI003530AB62